MNTQQILDFFAKLTAKISQDSSLIEKIEALIKSVTIFVIPDLTLAQRISSGNYDWKNDNIIEENFPHDANTVGEWEYRLIHPNKDISSEDAKALCESDGWQAAKLEHLLAFAEEFPEEQKKYSIVELGSVCELGNFRYVAALWYGVVKRGLGLYSRGGGWSSRCRFLSVRKVSGS